jgi:hypothetical protein
MRDRAKERAAWPHGWEDFDLIQWEIDQAAIAAEDALRAAKTHRVKPETPEAPHA